MSFAPLASCTLLYCAKESPTRGGSAWSVFLPATELPKAANALLEGGYHLEDICGLDAAEGYLCVYHFDHFTSPGRVTLRVLAPHDAPVFPSIAAVFQGAEWHERETADFYGFTFTGNPNPIPLLLPDDMAHLAPLRKDEAARAPLRVLLSLETREVVYKAGGFTLMDAPQQEEAAPKSQAAPAVEKPAAANLPAAPPPDSAALPAVKNNAIPALKTDASLTVKGENSLVPAPEALSDSVPEQKPASRAKGSDSSGAKTPGENPAKAAGKRGGASDA